MILHHVLFSINFLTLLLRLMDNELSACFTSPASFTSHLSHQASISFILHTHVFYLTALIEGFIHVSKCFVIRHIGLNSAPFDSSKTC